MLAHPRQHSINSPPQSAMSTDVPASSPAAGGATAAAAPSPSTSARSTRAVNNASSTAQPKGSGDTAEPAATAASSAAGLHRLYKDPYAEALNWRRGKRKTPTSVTTSARPTAGVTATTNTALTAAAAGPPPAHAPTTTAPKADRETYVSSHQRPHPHSHHSHQEHEHPHSVAMNGSSDVRASAKSPPPPPPPQRQQTSARHPGPSEHTRAAAAGGGGGGGTALLSPELSVERRRKRRATAADHEADLKSPASVLSDSALSTSPATAAQPVVGSDAAPQTHGSSDVVCVDVPDATPSRTTPRMAAAAGGTRLDLRARGLTALPCLHLLSSESTASATAHGSGDVMAVRLHALNLRQNSIRTLLTPFARTNTGGSLTTLTSLSSAAAAVAHLSPVPRSTPLSCYGHLSSLDLTHNELVSIAGVEGLRCLRSLRLAHNKLKSLAPLWASPHVAELDVLDVSSNCLTELLSADDVHALEAHQVRVVTHPTQASRTTGGQRSSKTTTLYKPMRLRVLYASHNQLREVPSAIYTLSQLADLQLRKNAIEVVPESFPSRACLPELTRLDLSGNRLPPAVVEAVTARAEGTASELQSHSRRGTPAQSQGDRAASRQNDSARRSRQAEGFSSAPAVATTRGTPTPAAQRYPPGAIQLEISNNSTGNNSSAGVAPGSGSLNGTTVAATASARSSRLLSRSLLPLSPTIPSIQPEAVVPAAVEASPVREAAAATRPFARESQPRVRPRVDGNEATCLKESPPQQPLRERPSSEPKPVDASAEAARIRDVPPQPSLQPAALKRPHTSDTPPTHAASADVALGAAAAADDALVASPTQLDSAVQMLAENVFSVNLRVWAAVVQQRLRSAARTCAHNASPASPEADTTATGGSPSSSASSPSTLELLNALSDCVGSSTGAAAAGLLSFSNNNAAAFPPPPTRARSRTATTARLIASLQQCLPACTLNYAEDTQTRSPPLLLLSGLTEEIAADPQSLLLYDVLAQHLVQNCLSTAKAATTGGIAAMAVGKEIRTPSPPPSAAAVPWRSVAERAGGRPGGAAVGRHLAFNTALQVIHILESTRVRSHEARTAAPGAAPSPSSTASTVPSSSLLWSFMAWRQRWEEAAGRRRLKHRSMFAYDMGLSPSSEKSPLAQPTASPSHAEDMYSTACPPAHCAPELCPFSSTSASTRLLEWRRLREHRPAVYSPLPAAWESLYGQLHPNASPASAHPTADVRQSSAVPPLLSAPSTRALMLGGAPVTLPCLLLCAVELPNSSSNTGASSSGSPHLRASPQRRPPLRQQQQTSPSSPPLSTDILKQVLQWQYYREKLTRHIEEEAETIAAEQVPACAMPVYGAAEVQRSQQAAVVELEHQQAALAEATAQYPSYKQAASSKASKTKSSGRRQRRVHYRLPAECEGEVTAATKTRVELSVNGGAEAREASDEQRTWGTSASAPAQESGDEEREEDEEMSEEEREELDDDTAVEPFMAGSAEEALVDTDVAVTDADHLSDDAVVLDATPDEAAVEVASESAGEAEEAPIASEEASDSEDEPQGVAEAERRVDEPVDE